MPPARVGNNYINFLATHDGLGIRPLEGILNNKDLKSFLNSLKMFGSKFTYRKQNNKSLIYEANISLADALSGTLKGKDSFFLSRYLCAHAILLCFEGTPAIYIHSLLGTTNDIELYKKNKIKRSINRHVYEYNNLVNNITNLKSRTNIIFYNLIKLIDIRKKQKAFHPNATQYTLNLGKKYFGVWRQSNDKKQSIFAISNITNKKIYLDLKAINIIRTESWYDLLSKKEIEIKQEKLLFMPYQSIWISNNA